MPDDAVQSEKASDGPTHITFLLGGVRSGKSARAVALAEAWQRGGRVLFVATGQAFDEEMTHRIAMHRAERPADWDTLESPIELPVDLTTALADARAAHTPYAIVVIDCLTLWVSNLLLALRDDEDAETTVAGHVHRLLAVRDAVLDGASWIVVSNEVGLGIVPPTTLGRRYRDALGRANRIVAAAADDVTLMIAGLELSLKAAPGR